MMSLDPIRVAIDAHVVGRRQTGNERYIVGLVDALARRDDVDVVVYLDGGVAWPGRSRPTIRRLLSRVRAVRLTVDLPRQAVRDRADLLQVQYVRPPVSRMPVVAVVHDISFEDIPAAFPTAMRLRLAVTVRHAILTSALVLTGSEFTRSRILDRYRIAGDHIVVTPYGIDDAWREPPADADLASVRALVPDAPFVAAIGNVHPRKNIPQLVRAVHIARHAGARDLRLVLVGQRSWQASAVDATIRELDAGSWVSWTGYVGDGQLRALYRLAAVVAYPSLYEGFGFPVGEAMASGATVVAARSSSIPEVAGDGALLFDPGSDQSLADSLYRAVSDEALRARLRDAGLRRAAELTWDRTAEATTAAYRSVLPAAASRGGTMNEPATYRAFEEVRDCPICRGSQLEMVEARASVLRCVRCGYRLVSPRPTQAEVARGYSLPGSYESWKREGPAREGLWRRRYRHVLEDRRPGRLLDVGAGLGTFLAIARAKGWTVAGTEVSEIAIAHARDIYGIDLVPGELRSDSVVGPFDVIALWHVIEHVSDPVSTLRICRSLLLPDGILIVGLPNDATSAQALSAIVRGARRLLGREIRPRYEVLRPGVESHLSHFTPRTIRRALAEAGLDVVRLGVDDAVPTRSRPGHAVFAVRRALTAVTPWNLGAEMLVVATPRSLNPAP